MIDSLVYEILAKLQACVGEIEALIEAEEKAFEDEMENRRRALDDVNDECPF